MSEDYDYTFTAKGEDRTVNFKFIDKVSIYLIEKALKSEVANDAVRFYLRYRIMGYPYGSWGNNPNKLVEIVELLKPIDDAYHPRLI